MARSFNDVAVDLMTAILDDNNKIDIFPGQVVRDVFVNGMAQEFSNLYNAVDTVAISQSISNATLMSTQALDSFVANFGIIRKSATSSTGQVIFYTNTIPTADILIPAATILGTGIGSGGQQITFQTMNDVNFFVALAATYFNINTGNYEVSANITCQQPGSTGNVGAYTITTSVGTNLPLSVINNNPTTGGYDQESNTDLAVRTINSFLGNGSGTESGYSGLINSLSYILDSNLIGPGNSLMTRDNGFGGDLDIWVIPTTTSLNQYGPTNTPSLSIPVWSDQQQVLVNYTFDFPILPVEPTASITVTATLSPSGNYINIPLFESRNPAPSGTAYVNPSGEGFHYTVQLDSSLNFGGSIYSQDQIVWNSSEMDYLNNLISGDSMSVSINYSSNTAISQAQAVLDSPNIQIIGVSALVKEAVQVFLDIQANVNLLPTNTETAEAESQTIGNIVTAVANAINTNQLGASYQEANLIQTIFNAGGVENIIIPSIVITQRFSNLFNITNQQVQNVSVNANQYFTAGNITINSV